MPQAGLSLRGDEPIWEQPRRDEPPRVNGRGGEPRRTVGRAGPMRSEAAGVPGAGVPGRRTVTIHGRGAERYRGVPERRRPARRPHERSGFKPDRAAMWAVMLCVLMILAAATSSHATMLSRHAGAAARQPALSGRSVTARTRVRTASRTPQRLGR